MAKNARRLIAMGEEMLAKAERLGAPPLAQKPTLNEVLPDFSMFQGKSPEAIARAIYVGRRIRDSLFPPHLFGEPAWEILLDLYVATKLGKPLLVKMVCIGAHVPNTTALRYIALVEECGLIEREGDPADNRRIYLRLSNLGMDLMDAFFQRTGQVSLADRTKRPELRLASASSRTNQI